jgi:hypothetical protein
MTKLKICPCCGQLIPPKLLFPRAPVSQRLYDFVAKRPDGATREEIADFIYADDPNGGPDSPSAIKALIWRMNNRLKSERVAIRGRMGRGSNYRLVAL